MLSTKLSGGLNFIMIKTGHSSFQPNLVASRIWTNSAEFLDKKISLQQIQYLQRNEYCTDKTMDEDSKGKGIGKGCEGS